MESEKEFSITPDGFGNPQGFSDKHFLKVYYMTTLVFIG